MSLLVAVVLAVVGWLIFIRKPKTVWTEKPTPSEFKTVPTEPNFGALTSKPGVDAGIRILTSVEAAAAVALPTPPAGNVFTAAPSPQLTRTLDNAIAVADIPQGNKMAQVGTVTGGAKVTEVGSGPVVQFREGWAITIGTVMELNGRKAVRTESGWTSILK